MIVYSLRTRGWQPALCTASAALLIATACRAGEPAAEVHLTTLARVASPVITLGDVAEVRTADAGLKQRLRQLDVAEFPAGAPSLRITRSQALLRIQLGRDLPRDITLVGAEWVEVQRIVPANADRLVTDRLAERLAQQWQAQWEDVEVKLTRPLPRTTPASLGPQDIDLVLADPQRPGNGRATVLIYQAQQLIDTWEITFTASLYREVVIARTDIPRGTAIQQHQLDAARRVVQRIEAPADMQQFLGRSARCDYKAGDELQPRMMIEPLGQSGLAVKPRDVVRLVAKRGALTVTVQDAEVIQGGEIGSQVRVRNPRSNKIVTARVVSPTELRVEF